MTFHPFVVECPACRKGIIISQEDLDCLSCKICRHLLCHVSCHYLDVERYPYWLNDISTSFMGDRIDWQVAVLNAAELVGHMRLHLWLSALAEELFGEEIRK